MNELILPTKGINEKCGLAGIHYNDEKKSAAETLYKMMLLQQGRGDQGAGIVSYDKLYDKFRWENGPGKVEDAFRKVRFYNFTGNSGIGHLEYSTVQNLGLKKTQTLQPLKSKSGDFYLGHNGTIQPKYLKKLMEEVGTKRTDSEAIVSLVDELYSKNGGDWKVVLEEADRWLDGSYTCEILTKEGELVMFREPKGYKPAHYTEIHDKDKVIGYAFASETSPLEWELKEKNIKSLDPGEFLVINEDGLKTDRFSKKLQKAACSFEFAYFQSPTSEFENVGIDYARRMIGAVLAKNDKDLDADHVGPVPSSGRSYAIGYSKESKLPYEEIFLLPQKNRTFIQEPKNREELIRMKYIPLKEKIEGKKIVLVDDSIVRNSTMKPIVSYLKELGAEKIDVRIGFPPVSYPCLHGGIAFSNKDELGMTKHKDVEGIRKSIGADSLVYANIEDWKKVIGNDSCFACIDGNYPLKEGTLKFSHMQERLNMLSNFYNHG